MSSLEEEVMQPADELLPAYSATISPPPYTDLKWKEIHKVNVTATEEPYTIYAWYSVKCRDRTGIIRRADFGYGYNPHSPEYYFSCRLIPEPGLKPQDLANHAKKILSLYLEHRRINSCNCSLASFYVCGFKPLRGPTPGLVALGLKHFLLDKCLQKCKRDRLGLSEAFRSWCLTLRLRSSLHRHGYMCACGCLRTHPPLSSTNTFLIY